MENVFKVLNELDVNRYNISEMLFKLHDFIKISPKGNFVLWEQYDQPCDGIHYGITIADNRYFPKKPLFIVYDHIDMNKIKLKYPEIDIKKHRALFKMKKGDSVIFSYISTDLIHFNIYITKISILRDHNNDTTLKLIKKISLSDMSIKIPSRMKMFVYNALGKTLMDDKGSGYYLSKHFLNILRGNEYSKNANSYKKHTSTKSKYKYHSSKSIFGLK